MSNVLYLPAKGLTWGVTREPMWNTKVLTSASGLESRASYYSYPIYRIRLSYEMLDERAGASDLEYLQGFINSRYGSWDSFLWQDPYDNAVTNQGFGTGDGTTTVFRLGRTLGGFFEPVSYVNGTPTIYKNGVALASGTDYTLDVTTAKVTFTTAPVAGDSLTWTGQFYWRVRFETDSAEFAQLLWEVWELKQLSLLTVKTT